MLSKTANTYSRVLLGVGIHDITAGYRAYRREVLEKIDLSAVDSKGYCFQIDLTWRTINNGFSVVEVPITFSERELGVSKMSGSNIREAMVKVAQWGSPGAWTGPAARRCSGARQLPRRFVLMMSRRSLSSSSSSSTDRRSSNMSQCVRGGLTFFGSGRSPSSRVPSRPFLHSQVPDLGVVGERDFELLAVLGAVPRDLTGRQVMVAVRLVAHGSEPAASQDTISHRQLSSVRVCPDIQRKTGVRGSRLNRP